jgi:hypothetical protein
MAIDLDGAVALVTGGANGIGAAVAAFGGLDVAFLNAGVSTTRSSSA